ncbi:MAG: BrnA antitoxin family protein [Syntrophobacteraceae bacterium]|nr:BrnA antitoxin family protein [Syntrophobacteraceae bacterium]
MKDFTTGRKSKVVERETDWEKLRSMSDAEVHAAIESDPEARPTDEEFWQDAEVVLPQRKQVVTMRIDADVLEWFRRQPGYQTRINAILRTYMKAHKDNQAV